MKSAQPVLGYLREHITIRITSEKGRGMFTSVAIPFDTLVEIAPVIVMDKAARDLLDETKLHDYIFEWEPDGQRLCCMALGYIPIYNHSPASNCEYFMEYEAELMSVKTVRDVAAGEELTINYNGDWNDTRPLWFEIK